MKIQYRSYRSGDFLAVGNFLVKHYQSENRDGNWLQPAWEYMHSHPLLDEESLAKIRVYEKDGEIVAVAHYEWQLGEGFFQLRPGYSHLKPDMLAYMEDTLWKESAQGKRVLHVFVNDFDAELEALVKSRGYFLREEENRPISIFEIPDPYPDIILPEGYRIQSLAEENDLRKIHRVLWRGFNHPGEPDYSDEEIDGRLKMQSVPNFQPELKVVALNPQGQFVSFCGLWYEPINQYAYVEPMATDPDYRRLGLGKAAMLEGIRRCRELGARVAYVGSDQAYYLASGFKTCFNSRCWEKNWA